MKREQRDRLKSRTETLAAIESDMQTVAARSSRACNTPTGYLGDEPDQPKSETG